jgi:hypothetical protein
VCQGDARRPGPLPAGRGAAPGRSI